ARASWLERTSTASTTLAAYSVSFFLLHQQFQVMRDRVRAVGGSTDQACAAVTVEDVDAGTVAHLVAAIGLALAGVEGHAITLGHRGDLRGRAGEPRDMRIERSHVLVQHRRRVARRVHA